MSDGAKLPLLLYVHVPFCTSKCHFCDWVADVPTRDLRQDSRSPARIAYLEALKAQIRYWGPRLEDYRPEILYWGGGTASILTEEEIVQLAGALRESFDLSGLSEATIESSPETLTAGKLACLFEQGFRRISIGVQSLDDARLQEIGRAHDAETGCRSVELARQAGFDDVNVDLISGLPGERLREREAALERAAGLPNNHYSVYPYRAANGTVLAKLIRNKDRYRITLEQQVEAYRHVQRTLEAAGFSEYCFNFFGSPPCRSDMAYFRLEMDWIGFGAGATSLLRRRYLSTARADLKGYLADPCRFTEDVPASSPGVMSRLAYQSLSTPWGMEAGLWRERLGVEPAEAAEEPSVRYLLDFFRRACGVTCDEAGIRLPRQEIARAFIHLQFLNAPARAQRREGAQRIFGGY